MGSESLTDSLTALLQRYGAGDRLVGETLFREIWPVLHGLAARQLSRERFSAPVTATELISEVWLRNLNRGGWRIENRDHFYAIASIAMRHVLVDLARQRMAAARGSGEAAVPLEENTASEGVVSDELEGVVQLGIFMERLEKKDRLGALIADMHYFAGYTFEEIAKATGLTARKTAYRWRKIEVQMKQQLMD